MIGLYTYTYHVYIIYSHLYLCMYKKLKEMFLIGETIKVLILTLVALKYLNKNTKGKKKYEQTYYKENKSLIFFFTF